MSDNSQQDALGLSLLLQDGTLEAFLTDFGLVARFGRTRLHEALFHSLQRDWHQTLARCSDLNSNGRERAADAAQVCALGSRLFDTLFPEEVRTFLRGSPARTISLQLSANLACLPWELAFDGEAFLGEKFRLFRRIVTNDPAPTRNRAASDQRTLRVLIVAGEAPRTAGERRAQGLIARLRIIEGIAVTSASAFDLQRKDLLALIGATDVFHYVGPVNGDPPMLDARNGSSESEALELHEIASLPAPPQLVISQNTMLPATAPQRSSLALAASACQLGLNIVICESAIASDQCVEFLLAAYCQLAEGASLGESVRAARSQVHQRSGIASVAQLQTELYGDGRVALSLRDRRWHGEDGVRHVTIMSFDLVESTRLLAAVGAEKYSEILAAYHKRCADIVAACGGAPNDPQGNDGLMCYFGFPVAREDAATQALRAALEIIEAVHALGLSVRIGISTGEVVVRSGQPVGPAIHFAARLQSIAAPGTAVVGEATLRVVRGRFRFAPLEHVPELKGFDQPGTLYRVAGLVHADRPGGIDDSATTSRMTPFVGRHRELQALQEHWAAAQSSGFRLVRVVGDAGIGKSRLVREFRHALASVEQQAFECRCAPDHLHSAFYPIVQWLRRQLRIGDGEPADAVLEKLERFATPAGGEGSVALLAGLLSVPIRADQALPGRSGERWRQETLDLLASLACLRLQSSAACLIVEDVHWIDPSTGEFLNRLAAEAKTLPLLVLLTTRPDADVRWHPRCAVHEIELCSLSPESSRMLVLGACGNARLPGEVVHLLAARADGVPLFIEESTRMVVEVCASLPAGAISAAELAVPATLLDLLTARLDRLGGAKQVAQIGGTIGREFSLGLLNAVLTNEGSLLSPHDLAAHLATLIRSGMLNAQGEGSDTRYVFKHALMRDAAYRSLLERDRARLHRTIAYVLNADFRSLAASQPELLAFHFNEAGAYADALRCWEAAARRAASRSAHVEAIAHVTHALSVLARLPRDANRDRIELRLQQLLATRLIATEGYGADRVERVYGRAMELCNALGDEAALMKILLGLEGYHFMRADFDKARAIAVDAGARARASGDTIHAIQSRWAIANILMHQGEMDIAVRQMDECLADCDRLEHRPDAVQDPGVMCLCYSAWGLWQLGYPDQALERAQAVVERAERLKHKFSIGEAYGFRAAIQHFRGDSDAALRSAERAIEVCEDCGFVVWLAHARLMRGRVMADLGDISSGNEEMRRAYDLWAATGAVVTTPFYLAMRAEGLALGGRPDDGLALLERALAVVSRTGERYYEAEVRRLFGQLVLQSAAAAGLDRNAEAESWLRSAHDCAHSRGLRSLALRAATGLADLWFSQSRTREAVEVLEGALRSLEEGPDTRDSSKARRMLAAARRPREFERH